MYMRSSRKRIGIMMKAVNHFTVDSVAHLLIRSSHGGVMSLGRRRQWLGRCRVHYGLVVKGHDKEPGHLHPGER